MSITLSLLVPVLAIPGITRYLEFHHREFQELEKEQEILGLCGIPAVKKILYEDIVKF